MPRPHFQIDPELTLMRETHRLVLSWQSLATEPFHSFLVSMHPQDIDALAAVLDGDPMHFESADGELMIHGDERQLRLQFSSRGDTQHGTHTLTGDARTRFRDAIEQLRR